jgi:HPt (histidine-containing phosphotransfer) domain-containing protein/anti-anti-sigma regulatory factor
VTSHSKDPYVLQYQGSLTLASAAHSRDCLLEALNANGDVVVDISRADDVDVTFVQVLVSALKSATAAGKTLSVGAANDDPNLAKLQGAAVSHLDFPARTDITANASTDIDPSAIATLIAEIGAPAVSQSLEVFFDEMSKRIAALQSLSPKADASSVRREAHLLKGTAGTFGLRKLADEVADVERNAADLEPVAYTASVERIRQLLEAAREPLRVTAARAA